MILLDTDVLSAVMRTDPDPRVFEWLDRQPWEDLYLSTITIEEVNYGIRLLPAGRRRRRLEKSLSRMQTVFAGHILDFDLGAAEEAAAIRAERRLAGRPMHVADAQIAGIAKSHALTLATFNTKDFRDTEIELFDPR